MYSEDETNEAEVPADIVAKAAQLRPEFFKMGTRYPFEPPSKKLLERLITTALEDRLGPDRDPSVREGILNTMTPAELGLAPQYRR